MASSIFISRLRSLPVLDGAGESVGRIRDVVLHVPMAGTAPRAKGLVIELFGRRRIYVSMSRVQSISAQQAVISGIVDTRAFQRRSTETLAIDDLIDRNVTLRGGEQSTIYDVAMRQVRTKDWQLDDVALRDQPRRRFGRPGHVHVVNWTQITNLNLATGRQGSAQLLALMEDMKPADIARELHDMSPQRRAEVAVELDDQTLASALEELPEDEQVQLISSLEVERAADVLEEMGHDDAADLIADLEPAKAEELLRRMEPEDAEDVRMLLSYAESTAGGMMTPEPVILPADATVADALAHLRKAELTPALASVAFVARAPIEAPTGRYLGGVHIQRLLREAPSLLISGMIDQNLQPLSPDASVAEVSRYFATYNLVIAPVVDGEHRLLGAVTVDDLLDHMLPEDWRGEQMDGEALNG